MAAEESTSLLVVGLGNPGSEYEPTRHNVGFMVLDELARRWRRSFRAGRGEFWWTEERYGLRRVIALRPVTFMNNSGRAVAEALHAFECTSDELLVIVDDIALPLGTLRLRPRGSDGGHNGIASVIYQLETEDFPRLRCGIRPEVPPDSAALADFVLSPFAAGEEVDVRNMIGRAADAAETVARSGLEAAMNLFNAKSG